MGDRSSGRQRRSREDRLHGDGTFWALSNNVGVPFRAPQFVVGSSLDVQGVIFNVNVYTKQLDDLTLFAPRLYPGMAPAPQHVLFYTGSGTARGIEALVQYKAPRNAIWASYALSRTEYTYPGLEAATFAGPTIVRTNSRSSTRSRSWVAGRPPAVGCSRRPALHAAHVDREYLVSVRCDGQRGRLRRQEFGAPAGVTRLDVSSRSNFNIGGVKSRVGGTLFNVYGRDNVLYYEFETAGQSPSSHEVLMMGRSLNLFFGLGSHRRFEIAASRLQRIQAVIRQDDGLGVPELGEGLRLEHIVEHQAVRLCGADRGPVRADGRSTF